jgi:signal transduction histidine kinase
VSEHATIPETSLQGNSQDDYEFLRGLVGGMRCGVLTVNRSGCLMLINEPALQILEIPAPLAAGQPVATALGRHPQLARLLQDSFQMSSLPNRAEIDLEFGAGRRKTVGLTLSMVPNSTGDIHGAAVFFKDLTYVEHKEEKERLKDRLASLGQMAANLAHEIRNPLASIEVTCTLLKRRLTKLPEEVTLLEKIVAEVRRLNATITSSLEFARPLELNLSPQDLHAVLDEAVTVALGRRGTPGISVETACQSMLPPFLMDREQLRQVFENLFLNAMEAMGDQGRLSIEITSTPAPASAMTPYEPNGPGTTDPWSSFQEYAVVQISDTGPGISAENIEKMFYPFFTTKKHGSGVGLSMARKVVDRHRGLMDVESEPGKGAMFTVRLPMIVENPEG